MVRLSGEYHLLLAPISPATPSFSGPARVCNARGARHPGLTKSRTSQLLAPRARRSSTRSCSATPRRPWRSWTNTWAMWRIGSTSIVEPRKVVDLGPCFGDKRPAIAARARSREALPPGHQSQNVCLPVQAHVRKRGFSATVIDARSVHQASPLERDRDAPHKRGAAQITICWPVMLAAPSESRKAAVAAHLLGLHQPAHGRHLRLHVTAARAGSFSMGVSVAPARRR